MVACQAGNGGWGGMAADVAIFVTADCPMAGSSGWFDVAADCWLGW